MPSATATSVAAHCIADGPALDAASVTAMVRVRAGISYALTEAMDEGHCGLPIEELITLAEKLLEVP